MKLKINCCIVCSFIVVTSENHKQPNNTDTVEITKNNVLMLHTEINHAIQ